MVGEGLTAPDSAPVPLSSSSRLSHSTPFERSGEPVSQVAPIKLASPHCHMLPV